MNSVYRLPSLALGLACVLLASAAPVASPAQTQPTAATGISVADMFAEVKRALQGSIIPEAQQAQIWNQAALEDASRSVGVVEGAKALLRKFGTSHTGLFTADEPEFYDLIAVTLYARGNAPEEATRIFGKTAPGYVGIGAWFEKGANSDRGWAITQTFPGTLAAGARLQPGDRIVRADGQPFQPVTSFTGKAGQVVKLDVIQGGKQHTIAVTPLPIRPLELYEEARRRSVSIAEIAGRSIGYVRPYIYFRDEDDAYLEDLLTTGQLGKADGIVIDLRGGWGATPLSFAQPFVGGLPEQVTLSGNGTRRKAGWNYCKPVVLLIDRSTRSGKELFAAAMKLNGTPLVGEPTAGQVLSTRAQIILGGKAIVETPRADVWIGGQRLEGKGVTPTSQVRAGQGDVDTVKDTGIRLAASMQRPGADRPVCRALASQ